MSLIVIIVASTLAAAPKNLECPAVMAHVPVAEAHPGWTVYSNKPLRLSGMDVEYVVDGHLEATLDPDDVRRPGDSRSSTVSVFDLGKHRSDRPFVLVCHYGVHAQLSRNLPQEAAQCVATQHEISGADDTEFEAYCK